MARKPFWPIPPTLNSELIITLKAAIAGHGVARVRLESQPIRLADILARRSSMFLGTRVMSLFRYALMVLSAVSLSVGAAHATTQTTTFTVSVTITASCTISASNLAFGSQGVLAANVDQTSTITVQCTNTTPYTVGLDNGLNFSGGTRRMKDTGAGTTFVNYALYTDSARTLGWLTTTTTTTCTGGANTCAIGTGAGSNQTITVYGRIPSQTTPAPATFNDTVTATITY
jgi:spore coat protein U-like protein